MQFQFASQSVPGLVKPINQDAFCYREASCNGKSIIMAIVCDGVGGLAKGELASTTVVQRFAMWFEHMLPVFLEHNLKDGEFDVSSLQGVWDTMLRDANRDIQAHSAQCGSSLGTTFTGMFVFDDRYLVGHIGDTRIYEITTDTVTQITHDQTLVQQELDRGNITPEQALTFPRKHVILQSVGTQEALNPVFFTGDFNKHAIYLMCSDGFSNQMSDEELLEEFDLSSIDSEMDMKEICTECVQLLFDKREKDNITVFAFCAPEALGGDC